MGRGGDAGAAAHDRPLRDRPRPRDARLVPARAREDAAARPVGDLHPAGLAADGGESVTATRRAPARRWSSCRRRSTESTRCSPTACSATPTVRRRRVNAAGAQIAPSVALAASLHDLRDITTGRPASPGPQGANQRASSRPPPQPRSSRCAAPETTKGPRFARGPLLNPETGERAAAYATSRSFYASASVRSFLSDWFSIWRMRSRVTLIDARRGEAAARMGFSAYGVTQGDDPVALAMKGLIDNAATQEHQIALLWCRRSRSFVRGRALRFRAARRALAGRALRRGWSCRGF